jgi:hypothetical protein
MDLAYAGITLAFFALSWGLVLLCSVLGGAR